MKEKDKIEKILHDLDVKIAIDSIPAYTELIKTRFLGKPKNMRLDISFMCGKWKDGEYTDISIHYIKYNEESNIVRIYYTYDFDEYDVDKYYSMTLKEFVKKCKDFDPYGEKTHTSTLQNLIKIIV
jgi:hypothetical protein